MGKLLVFLACLAIWAAIPGCGDPGDEGAKKKRVYVQSGLLNELWTPPPYQHRNDGHWPTWWFVYDRLIENSPDFEPEYPNLASRWESSEDGLQHTFYLRHDVRWHDGRPFTARDVETTFLFILDGYISLVSHLSQFVDLAGLADYRSGKTEKISGLKVIDDHTIQFNLLKPAPFFLWSIGYVTILPKHQLDIVGESKKVEGHKIWRDAVGTGPFKLVETAPFQFVRLEKYEDYHHGTPLIDEVIIHDKETALASLKMELDLGNATPEQAAEIVEIPHMTIEPGRSIHLTSVILNVETPALVDRRVRRALLYAIDRKAIGESTFGRYTDVEVPHAITPATKWRNRNLEPINYDPERARALLQEAGWDPQTEIMINLRDIDFKGIRLEIATIVQDYWKQIGVNAKVEAVEAAILSERRLKGEYEVYVGGSGSVVPIELLRYRTESPSPLAYGYSNPQVDALIAQIDTTHDLAQLHVLYNQLEEYVWEDVAIMPIVNTIPLLAKSKRLRTGPLTPNNNHPIATWWHLWEIVE